jgi:hypothetical protein
MEALTKAYKTAKKDYEDILHEFKALRYAAKDDLNDKMEGANPKKKVSRGRRCWDAPSSTRSNSLAD